MLSNRKLKAFDRPGGAYLVLPWPDGLPPAEGMPRDEGRAASQREHLAAMREVAPIVRDYGLVHIATQVAMLHQPSRLKPRDDRLYLLAHLVTPRYQRATRPGARAPAQWPTEPDAIGGVGHGS